MGSSYSPGFARRLFMQKQPLPNQIRVIIIESLCLRRGHPRLLGLPLVGMVRTLARILSIRTAASHANLFRSSASRPSRRGAEVVLPTNDVPRRSGRRPDPPCGATPRVRRVNSLDLHRALRCLGGTYGSTVLQQTYTSRSPAARRGTVYWSFAAFGGIRSSSRKRVHELGFASSQWRPWCRSACCHFGPRNGFGDVGIAVALVHLLLMYSSICPPLRAGFRCTHATYILNRKLEKATKPSTIVQKGR